MIESMGQLFNCGDIIYGFCNGYFGSDNYETKRCVMIYTKYAVFEYEDHTAIVLNFDTRLTKEVVEEWKNKEEDRL